MTVRGVTGYATLTGPAGQVREKDTFTCNHCQAIRGVTPNRSNPYEGVGDLCYGCNLPVCERCAQRLGQGFKCVPFEKALEAYEAKHRLRADIAAG